MYAAIGARPIARAAVQAVAQVHVLCKRPSQRNARASGNAAYSAPALLPVQPRYFDVAVLTPARPPAIARDPVFLHVAVLLFFFAVACREARERA